MSKSISQRQHTVKLETVNLEPASLPPRTDAGEAFNTLIGQIVRLIRLFDAAGDALAKPAGQTLARWLVLETVEDTPAPVAQIARALGLARQSVQRVADLLVREELAVYQENPKHRRAKLMALTPKGRSALYTIQSAQRVWANELGAEIGEADLRQANAVLSEVLRVMREHRS